MNNMSDDLKLSAESEAFVALADKIILGLGDLARGKINTEALDAGVHFCSTILEGKRAYEEGKPGWGQRAAFAKYSLLQSEKERLTKQGVDLEEVLAKVEGIHKVLSEVLKYQKMPDSETITNLRKNIEQLSMPFWHVASRNLLSAKAQKGFYR